MKVAELIGKIEKFKRLIDEEILSFTEYNNEVDKIIKNLSNSHLEELKEDFLLGLIPLIKSKSITNDQLTRIKQIVLENAFADNQGNKTFKNIIIEEDNESDEKNAGDNINIGDKVDSSDDYETYCWSCNSLNVINEDVFTIGEYNCFYCGNTNIIETQ